MKEKLDEFESTYKVKITCSLEKEPMGTAGPIRLAEEMIRADNPDGLFFVFNSDVICEFPLKDMIEYHKSHGKEGTIMVTKVSDPSKYGVVVFEGEAGPINKFVEKPQVFVGDKINAGLYLFNLSIIERIPNKPTSIERETFPLMSADAQLNAMTLPGFWMDIGQPKDFLTGTTLYLEYQKRIESPALAQGDNILGNVLIHPTAKVDPNAVVGPNVVVGAGCVVEGGVRLSNSCLLSDTTVKGHSFIKNSIIGWSSTIGKWVRIDGLTVLAKDVTVKDEVYINASFILPHKAISTNVPNAGTIIM